MREHQEPFLLGRKATKLSSEASCSPQERSLKNTADMFFFPIGKSQQISSRETMAEINFGAQPHGLMWVPCTQLFLQAALFPPHFYQGIMAAPAQYAKNS